jgi:hypothetical protein
MNGNERTRISFTLFLVWRVYLIRFFFKSFLCCPIICLYVLSSVLWFPLRLPHKKDFRLSLHPVVCKRDHVLFTFVVCASIYINKVASNTYCENDFPFLIAPSGFSRTFILVQCIYVIFFAVNVSWIHYVLN